MSINAKSNLIDNYYFDKWQKKTDWTEIGPTNENRLKNLISFIQKYFTEPYKIKIIDFGCGSGWLFHYLNNLGIKNLYGYDITPSTLTEVKKRYPYVKSLYSKGNKEFSDLPILPNFDLCTSIEVIEHIRFQDKNAYLEQAHSLLRNGGYLYLTTPNGKYFINGTKDYQKQPVEDWCYPKEIISLLKRNGFKIISKGSIHHRTNLSNIHKILLSTKVVSMISKLKLNDVYFQCLNKCMLGLSTYYFCQKID